MKKYLVLIFIFLATSFINGQNFNEWEHYWLYDKEAPAAPTSLFVNGLQEKDSIVITPPTALDYAGWILHRESWFGSGVYNAVDTILKGTVYYIDSALTTDSVYRYLTYAFDNSGNISSASSTAYDTVKPILYYADFDGSTEYGAKTTPELSLQGTYALNETFSDGDYTTGNVWTVSSGSYAVVDSVGYSGLAKSLRCATAGIISIPCNWSYGSIEFDLYRYNFNNPSVYIMSASTTGTLGYRIYRDSGAMRFFSHSGLLMGNATSSMNNSVWHRFKITRNTNGSFSIYLKGDTFGSTYTLVSTTGGSGTNPVTDNTYTQSNYFVLDLDAGDMIANIQCQYGMGSLDLNGHEMVRYPYRNSSFEGADTTYFAGNGTHSADTSSTYKQAGSYSMKVISGGVGDTTTNHISLAYNQFEPIVAGKKYTIEYWANAASPGDYASTTKPRYTLKIGSKSSQSDTIAVYPNLWEKVVYTFQATSAEVNTPIKIYCSQADTGWIDNFSITQAKDLMVNVWAAWGVPTGYEVIFSWQTASTGTGYVYGNATSNARDIGLTYNDNSSPVINASSTTALLQSTYYMHTLVIDRTDSIIIYKNGVKVAGKSIVNEGIVKHTSPFRIGCESYGTSYPFTGQIGETQIVTFDDIATETTWTPSAIYYRSKAGFNFPTSFTGGVIVASYRWAGASDAEFLNDESASANDLTGTNLTQALDQFRLLGY